MAGEVTTWIDPDGAQTTLDVDWAASGRYMPKVVHEEDGVPGQPGMRHRASRHDVHEFTLKIWMIAADELMLRALMRTTVASMNPTRGEGTLRVTSPIGDVRDLGCFYADGLGMEESPENSGPNMQAAGVVFRAYDPYWRDTSDIIQTFTIGAIPTFFPIFPLRLTSSQIAATSTVVNSGDVPTWPVLTVTGPGSSIVLRNMDTGEYLQFSTLTLGAGESVIVDTRPGHKTAIKGDGTNVHPDLDIASTMWALPVGSTSVRLEMAGATAGVSALSLAYKQKYLSP